MENSETESYKDQNTIVVVVCNYDFNDNACKLKEFFAKAFPTILIDASSPSPPKDVDLIIANEGYRGLWNAAAQLTLEHGHEWLFFIASDVELIHADLMIEAMRNASRDDKLAMWTPSISVDSRHSYKSCTHRSTSLQRICGVPEGFCFMIRSAVLRDQYPVPSSNQYGYKIDMASAVMARTFGNVVVDDRVLIFHPAARPEHRIDAILADQLGEDYLSSLNLDTQIMQEILCLELLAIQGQPTPSYGERRCLELGCGPNIRDPFITGDAWGVDLISTENQSAKVKTADLVVDAIPFEDQSFDHVYAFNLLAQLPRLAYVPQRRLPLVELMNEIHRVLKPGGLFLSLCAGSPSLGGDENSIFTNVVTEKTLADGYCEPQRFAAAYGYVGRFQLEHQRFQEDGQLLTLMRCIPSTKVIF